MAKKASRKGRAPFPSAEEPSIHEHNSDSAEEAASDLDGNPTYERAVNLPAHQTKHLAELTYRFPAIHTCFEIVQHNDTNSTGSSLWLSSQVLSSYLIHTYAKHHQSTGRFGTRKRVLELGSGTGLLSLLMARLGWQVIATDIPPVLDSVLKPNVQTGLYQLANAGTAIKNQIHVAELDWTIPWERWHWHPTLKFPSTTTHIDDITQAEVQHTTNTKSSTEPRLDLILTADTIYEPSLIQPLLSTIAHFYHRQGDAKPTVLLALERRDPAHITEALRIAKDNFDLAFKQVPPKRVRKIFDSLGDGTTWSRDDWDGVEIWKL